MMRVTEEEPSDPIYYYQVVVGLVEAFEKTTQAECLRRNYLNELCLTYKWLDI